VRDFRSTDGDRASEAWRSCNGSLHVGAHSREGRRRLASSVSAPRMLPCTDPHADCDRLQRRSGLHRSARRDAAHRHLLRTRAGTHAHVARHRVTARATARASCRAEQPGQQRTRQRLHNTAHVRAAIVLRTAAACGWHGDCAASCRGRSYRVVRVADVLLHLQARPQLLQLSEPEFDQDGEG
jgi:hypothetical protein